MADSLFKGASVVYIDVKKQADMVEGLGISGPFPKLTFSELEPGKQLAFYSGPLSADYIRLWAQKKLAFGK